MKKLTRFVLTLGVIFLAGRSFSQNLFYKSYTWEENPVLEELSEDENQELALFLKDLRTIEYAYDLKYQTIVQYYTIHNRIRVNSHDAIEMYNKEYIPMGRVLDIEGIKVRVITKDGVREINDVDLKDYEGDDEYSSLKYFAIEGVEIGSEIEYIYTLKMAAKFDGSREFFQSHELRKGIEFNIFSPDDMFFITKSYNGFAEIQYDSTVEGKNHYVAMMDKIDPLVPELYAPYNNKLMRVEYKLDHIRPAVDFKLFTYDQLANQLNQYLKADVSKKDEKKLKKIIDKLELNNFSGQEKVRAIEDYVKGNYTIIDQGDDQFEEIEKILENMYCNKRGVVRLFVSLFDLAGINYSCGFTSDRSVTSLDPEFESYSFLENYLFYFPDYDEYMAPTEALYRLGFIPFNWSNNYGLFIKSVTVGGKEGGVGEIKFIKPLPFNKSEDRLTIDIDFEGDFDALNLNIKRALSGYNATFIQPIFEYVPETETKTMVNELLNLSGKDIQLNDFKISNSSFDSIYIRPFVVEGSARTSSSFYDRAGNRYLLKIGEVIGEQVEMYQEKERELPVQNDYNRNYVREISFEIPKGYSVSNLDDLKVDISYKDEKEGDVSMAFTSDYRKEGNTIKVIINEYYKKLDYSVEHFEDFRKVINAAADFNKKILIFEKG